MSNVSLPILLIEDNPMDVDLTIRAFRSQNFANDIDVCRDGEEAIEQIAQWDSGKPVPAVILLDINMPKINGIEVLRTFKSHERYKRIPVVVLTTSTENKDLMVCYDLGANSYIVKPVSFVKFQEVAKKINLYWILTNTLPPMG